jgi:hypothetical protein
MLCYGVQASTASSMLSVSSKVGAPTPPDGAPPAQQPPFRSENERRQWLLNEKRKWIVEMRLGHALPEGDEKAVDKLPPISSHGHGHVLMSGAALDTVATPRR